MTCNYNLYPPQTSDKMPVVEENVELGELNPAQVNMMILTVDLLYSSLHD